MKELSVVAGILIDGDDRILIADRPQGSAHGAGYWEFPGGKIDAGESSEVALRRELQEEIAISATRISLFHQLSHEYRERRVHLEFFLVSEWQGEPYAKEGQQLVWVPRSQLHTHRLLPADKPVVDRLQRRQGLSS